MHEELLQYLFAQREAGMAVDISANVIKQMPEAERDQFIAKLVGGVMAQIPAEAKEREDELRNSLTSFYRIGAGLESGSLVELVQSFNRSQANPPANH